MQPAARPALGTHILFVEDEGLVFSEPRQELHALNTMAAVIWCLLLDGRSPDGIAADLCARFALPPRQATAFVADALADWAGKGLLAGTQGPERASPPPGWQPRPGLPSYPQTAPTFVETRSYRLLTMRFRVRFGSASQAGLVRPVLAHLEEAGTAETCFDLLAAGQGALLFRDGEPQDACAVEQELVPMVYACVWMAALRAYSFFLNIHAGVVRGPAGCALLPAPPGSGKSILTAALVASGLDYFSDEVALLALDDLRVAPFPQAFCFKQSGIPTVARFFPETAALPLHARRDGKRVAYLPPPKGRLPATEDLGTVRALVFPRYEPGAATSCKELPRTAALGRMFGQCTVIDHRLDVAAVKRLVTWIEGVACRELVYGSTPEGVSAVAALLADGSA